jgi:hypothetical protein
VSSLVGLPTQMQPSALAGAVEGLADDVRVAAVARSLFDHVEQDVAHVALDEVFPRAGLSRSIEATMARDSSICSR